MVLEHALLDVVPGQESSFEDAFGQAKQVISSMPGFRDSAQYEQWRALLHHFYDPFPTVEHYESVTTA
jgi:hypothetical protein